MCTISIRSFILLTGLCPALLLYLSTSLACGPEWGPRYPEANYFDPDLGPNHNFHSLLRDWVKTPSMNQQNEQNLQHLEYFFSLSRLLLQSGRPIAVNNFSNSLEQEMCRLGEALCQRYKASQSYTLRYRSRLSYAYNYYDVNPLGSNSYQSTLSYIEQVLASPLSDSRVIELMDARENLANYRDIYTLKNNVAGITQSLGNVASATKEDDITAYLRAALEFYQGQYQPAFDAFNQLTHSSNPWIAETSLYLTARIQSIMAQKSWNGYSAPSKSLDFEQSRASRKSFERYLAAYPQGLYVASAQGLLRRLDFLEGNQEAYTQAVLRELYPSAKALVQDPNKQNGERFVRLFNEWRLHSNVPVDFAKAGPLLITYAILHSDEDDEARLAILEREKVKFSSVLPLWNLLHDWVLYKANRLNEIKPGIVSDDTRSEVTLGHSVLLAKVLLQRGDYAKARDLLVKIPARYQGRFSWDSLQLQLAYSYIAQGDYRAMANKDSGIVSVTMFEDAFHQVCDVDTLIDIANDANASQPARDKARYEAFARYIVRGDFKNLYGLFTRIQNVGEFSLIETAARSLAKHNNDRKGLVNLAYFMLMNMYAPYPELQSELRALNQKPDQCKSIYFQQRYFGPREYLARVVAQHSEKSKSVEEAKALHYLTECNKPGSAWMRCHWGSEDAPVLTSEQAFKRLHDKYPKSKWAKKTPYYYH